jgi:hypothetical protein
MSSRVGHSSLRAALEEKAAALREDLTFEMGTEASELTAVALVTAGIPILTPPAPTPMEHLVWSRLRVAGAEAALKAMVEEAIATVGSVTRVPGTSVTQQRQMGRRTK